MLARSRLDTEHGLGLGNFARALIPLVIPALLGLQREWREAATSLGATPARYWLHVALPILAPSLLGSFLLLFANAFGAYATAWTLTGPDVNLVTVQIAALVRGE